MEKKKRVLFVASTGGHLTELLQLKDIFNNYRDVYLSIDEKKIHYKAIAVKIISTDNEHMKVAFKNDVDFLKHMNRLLNNSLYKSEDSSITKNDRILVLQVCHYDPPDTYLLLICKEVH